MVTNVKPKDSPCFQASPVDAKRAVDAVPNPLSAVILVASAAANPDRFTVAVWVMVNRTVAYNTRFVDAASARPFIEDMKTYLVGKVGRDNVVVAPSSDPATALPCPPPEDAIERARMIEAARAKATPEG